MQNAIATFNAWVRSQADTGIPVHVEPDELTKWPSYRITWLSIDADSRTSGFRALVELMVNVKDHDTAGCRRRAQRLLERIGLQGYQQRPRILMKDWTDPKNPVDLPQDQYHNWMEYGLRLGRGWQVEQPADEAARSLKLSLEVFFYGH